MDPLLLSSLAKGSHFPECWSWPCRDAESTVQKGGLSFIIRTFHFHLFAGTSGVHHMGMTLASNRQGSKMIVSLYSSTGREEEFGCQNQQCGSDSLIPALPNGENHSFIEVAKGFKMGGSLMEPSFCPHDSLVPTTHLYSTLSLPPRSIRNP